MFLLISIVSICVLAIFYIKWNYTYWQRKGFPYLKPKIPFGILNEVIKQKQSFGTACFEAYRNAKENVIGIYIITRPALLICDAQLARNILTKEFESFHDRGIHVDDENDPQTNGGLFSLKGREWKNLRIKLTPSFTSGKLKSMFGTVEDVANKMVNYLNTQITDENNSKEVEMKKLLSTYAIDIIASAILGLEVNSFVEANNEIIKVSHKINENTFGSVMRGTAQFLYPSLENLFIRLGWREEAPNMMRDIVKRTIEMREDRNIVRKDLLQLLMQLRNTGHISTDDNDWQSKHNKDSIKHMSIETVASNLYLFYVAGYETTASTIAFTTFELAQNSEALNKVQQNVRETLEKHNNEFTYDAVQDMKYLDFCIMETTRKYPALPILNRQCLRDYPLPDSNLVIKSGTPIIISLLGLHRDEKYFPDPMNWNPERFVNKNYDPVAFMPFGEGPRHCIAQRMGTLNAKVALAKLLLNFNIESNPVKREIEIANYGIPIMAKGGVNVRLSKRK